MNASVAHDWSPHDVRRFLLLLHGPGDLFEIRILRHGTYKSTASGYFDNVDGAIEAIRRWDGRANTYVTLNPCDPALLARAHNRIIDRADTTTSDSEITRRRWLFIDIDPIRPRGISATDEEVAAARAVADEVAAFLIASGWPEGIAALSGNGSYVLFRLDLPNDAEATALIQRCLAVLSERFSKADAHIDESVFNSARIIAVVGTMKVKGDPLPDRPHRRSCIVHAPDELECVTRAQLETLAGGLEGTPAPRVRASGAEALAAILDRHGVAYRTQPPDANDIVWEHVERCPFHEDGRAFECGVGQSLRDGHYAAHCFHPEGRGKTWHDWKAALGISTTRSHDPAMVSGAERKQIVITHRHLRDMAEDGWDGLGAHEASPRLFRHGDALAEVAAGEDGRAKIVHLSVPRLRGRLDRCADWLRADGDGLVPARPPKDVVEDMLALPRDLPVLRGIIGTPAFAADGALDLTPGYQASTSLYYEPSGEPVPPVPSNPDATDLRRAKAILYDLLCDFPFADEASKAHAIAIPVTGVAREMIAGPTPAMVFNAPTPGSGKTLLAGCLGLIVSGAPPAVMTAAKNEEEWRKRITSILRGGSPVALFDNIKHRLSSESISGLLTCTVWADRLLSKNVEIRLPVRTIWMLTGNNIELDSDIARRAVGVNLDAMMDRPWDRANFRHALPEWAFRHRHELVWASLVLVQHWVASGRPAWDGKPLGSYEEWCRVVGGVLQAAGINFFLDNREQLYARMDVESEEWREFVSAWWQEFADRETRAAALYPMALEILPSMFLRAKDDAKESALKATLGRAIATRRDRRFGDLFIRSGGDDAHAKVNTWRLEFAGDDGPDRSTPADPPQENESTADSLAGDAGIAGDVSGVGAIKGVEDDLGGERDRGGNQPPQPPHSPQLGSEVAQEPAGDARGISVAANEPPQEYRCTRCRMPMSSARVGELCGWCVKT